MNIAISVIIPFYNAETFLPRCIDSLRSQSIENAQFIFVNDESTDKGTEIVESFVNSDNRAKLISICHAGQGAARNEGINHALGEYIVFLDADDYIADDCLGTIYQCCKDKNLDILVPNICMIGVENPTESGPMDGERVRTGKERLCDGIVTYTLCRHVIRRKLILDNEIRFLEAVRFEDMDFVVRIVYFAEKVMDFDMPFYYYVSHTNSVSTKQDEQSALDYFTVASCVAIFVRERVDEKTYALFFRDYLAFLFSHTINMCIAMEDSTSILLGDEEKKEKILIYIRKGKSIKYKIQYFMIKCGLVKLYELLYKYLKE